MRLLILLYIFFSPTNIMAQARYSKDQKEVYNTIVLIGNAWTQNDMVTLEEYIDKDYIHTDVRGQIFNKRSWLDYVKDRKNKNVTNPSLAFEDLKITIYNDIALVTGINSFYGQAFTTNDSTSIKPRKLRFSQVLKKENKNWKRIAFQATYIE